MHIGRNISKVRELLGIEQQQLALALKINKKTLSKIEQAEHLTDNVVGRMAQALGVSRRTLVEFDETLVAHIFETPLSGPTSRK